MPIAMADSNADLRAVLETLDPKARDDLRRVLIRDQADREAISSRLMRYRDQNGDDWADIIDMLTMHPDERRRVARLVGRWRRKREYGTSRLILVLLRAVGPLATWAGPHQAQALRGWDSNPQPTD
jgi:hypothetical protein